MKNNFFVEINKKWKYNFGFVGFFIISDFVVKISSSISQ